MVDPIHRDVEILARRSEPSAFATATSMRNISEGERAQLAVVTV
jgi:hypothetical protein